MDFLSNLSKIFGGGSNKPPSTGVGAGGGGGGGGGFGPGTSLRVTPAQKQAGGVTLDGPLQVKDSIDPGNFTGLQKSQPASGGSTGSTGGGSVSAQGGGVVSAAQGGGTAKPELGNLRKDIKGRLDAANKVFDLLVGDIDDVLQSRRQEVEQQFGNQRDQLTDQFNQEIPGLSRAFTARGLADSSFRENALNQAGNQFDALLKDVGQEQQSSLAELGEFGATQKANIAADKGSISDVLARLPQIQDENQLLQELDNAAALVRDLQARRSGLQSDQSFQRGLEGATNTTALPQLQQQLSKIVNGLAPAPLKAKVARGLISNSGLPSNQARQLFSQFQAQLGQDEEEEQG